MSDLSISTLSTAMDIGYLTGSSDELKDVENKLAELLPGVSSEDLTSEIKKYVEANPSATPSEVLEAVVTKLNPDVTTEQVSALRTEWEQFAQTTGLPPDALLEVMAPPETTGTTTSTSVKDMMAALMMLMIEVFGEDAASSLLEGFQERDTIMKLAKDKASELRAQAGWQLGLGLCSAGCSIVGGIGGMGMSKNSALSQGFTTMMQGSAKVFDSFSQFATSLIQANIAEIDGKSQAAQVRKETAQKLEDMARDLIKTMIEVYQNLASQEYQTLTKIANC